MDSYDKNSSNNYNDKSHGLLLGTMAILAGVLLIVFNNCPYEYNSFAWNLKHLIFSWPMILVVIGLLNLSKREWNGGTILLLVGLIFLAPRAAFIFAPFPAIAALISSRNMIYLIPIVFGVVIIANTLSGRSWEKNNGDKSEFEKRYGRARIGVDDDKKINYSFTFSGAEQAYLEPVFYGGRIKCTFGGVDLNMRHTSLPEGETILEITSTFGGANLKVPDDWYVEIRSYSTFGGFVDERKIIGTPDHSRKLIIIARCTFGGGSIQ